MADKITVDEIKSLVNERTTYYSTLHAEQKTDDNYYELVYDASVPTELGYDQRTPQTARDWVDIGVRHFTLDNPKAKVFARGNSDTARRKDGIMEAFYNFWLRLMILQIKEAAKKLLLRGESFFKIWIDDTYFGLDVEGLDKEQREERERQRLFHFPLIVNVPDPINVFTSPAHNDMIPVDVVESYALTVSEALNLCKRNGWKWETNKKGTNTVKWVSYISDEWRCFLLDDVPVLTPEVQPNILGFCPYVHIPSGFGQKSYEGKPEYLYRSILYGPRDMIKMESRVLSQVDAMNARYAWPKIKVTGEEEDVKQLYGGGKLKLSPNEVIRETERVKVEVLQGEQPPPAVFQQLAMVSARAGPPVVLSGSRPSGVYSAQGIEDLLTTAKPIYKDAFKNLEDGLAILLCMGARIIDTVYKQPVGIKQTNAITPAREEKVLKPEDIDGHYDCQVQLLAEPPEATDIRKTLGTNQQKSGVISHLRNLRDYQDMSLEDAMDEIAQIWAERAMQMPGMLEVVARDAMRRLGLKQEEEQLREAEERVSTNLPPRRLPATMETGAQGVPRHGRMMPGLEGIASPQETALGQVPIAR